MRDTELDFNVLAQDLWFQDDAIVLTFFSEEIDDAIAEGGHLFELWARRFGKSKLIYKTGENSMEYLINTPLSGGIASDPLVFTALNPVAWHKQWLDLMAEMEKGSSCLIRLNDTRQVWLSSKFKSLFPDVSVQTLLSNKTKDVWLPESFERLEAELKSKNDFEISYTGYADEKKSKLINLTARNKVMEIDGVWYRLSTNIAAEPVAA